jgi:cyanate lyase
VTGTIENEWNTQMNKAEMKEAILQAKFEKGLKWSDIAKAAGMSPEYLCSACLGMNHLDKKPADAVAKVLGLRKDVSAALQRFTTKTWTQTIPTDPLIYRWYEIVGVYGETIKEMINEKFGDGIMSAIDFSMDIAKQEDPKGDRVVVTLNGKFLPYKAW